MSHHVHFGSQSPDEMSPGKTSTLGESGFLDADTLLAAASKFADSPDTKESQTGAAQKSNYNLKNNYSGIAAQLSSLKAGLKYQKTTRPGPGGLGKRNVNFGEQSTSTLSSKSVSPNARDRGGSKSNQNEQYQNFNNVKSQSVSPKRKSKKTQYNQLQVQGGPGPGNAGNGQQQTQQSTNLNEGRLEPLPEVDPELAGLVCRKVIMPLFESYNTGGKLGTDSNDITCGIPKDGVVAEVKLSDKLVEAVMLTRNELQELKRRYTSSCAECEILHKKLALVKKKTAIAKNKLERNNQKEQAAVKTARIVDSRCKVLARQKRTLTDEKRKVVQDNEELKILLLEAEEKVQVLSSQVEDTDNTASLAKLENEVLVSEMRDLHASANSLFKETKYYLNEIEYSSLTGNQKISQIQRYRDELELHQDKLLKETQYLEKVQGELLSKKRLMETDCSKLQQDLDEAASRQHHTMSTLQDDKERLSRERDKLSRKLKELTQDYEKLKQRWKKYRARRKLFEQESKTCKNCGREYTESENFNWSCRTHQSDFGGELWWCCGKQGSQALGCKFSKHESKDDEDEIVDDRKNHSASANEDGEDGGEGGSGNSKANQSASQKAKNAKLRCYSCKELGHKSKDCPRDPNIHTSKDPIKELRRIDQLSIVEKKKKLKSDATGSELIQKINDVLKYTATEDDIPQTDDDVLVDVKKMLRVKLRARRKAYRQHLQREGRIVPERLILPQAAFTTDQELMDDQIPSSDEEEDDEEYYEEEEEEDLEEEEEDLEEDDLEMEDDMLGSDEGELQEVD